jgi:GTP-binding protein YchF
MKAGIVGLPNVGKSTLFNCLSNTKAQSANFPFCTIEPNIGIINVPDKRLNLLESYVDPEKVIPANVEIVDIAGLVKGASKGEGLGNQFLANIRETDAIIHVLRCFDDNNIVHVEGSINPVRDKEIIDLELQLKDLETLEKRKEKISRLIKTGNKDAIFQNEVLVKIIMHLQSFQPVRSIDLTEKQKEFSDTLDLITNKPVLYVCNVDEGSALIGNNYVSQVKESIKNENSDLLILAVAIEADINELDNYDDRRAFLEDIGLSEAGSSKLIKKAYDLLNLQTYFTAGKKEVRAWTIHKGMTAPQAAGVIHTDFEKGFIRAEVISFNDYSEYKNEINVKEAGKLKIEGKDYIVKDGDVMHFRFNV